MTSSYQKTGLWLLITISIFSVFRWLFGLAMPGAALEFALGITVILMGGLIFGRFVSRIWFKSDRQTQNVVFASLTAVIILGFIAIGVLVNKMIGNTQFMHFFFTVIALFTVTASMAAIVSLVRNRIRTRIQAAQNALVQTKSELQVLQSQLSPHFLFNTLNNLYGLSISEYTKVPNLLLKLSDLLRYSVYEGKEMFVPLKDELEYLKNYIEFEKIRLGERLNLKLNLEEVLDASVKIAPMLLIVFVENAFKHSRDTVQEKVFIEIDLRLVPSEANRERTGEKRRILFSVRNSHFKSGSKSEMNKKHSGFGLESVRKRLNFLYHNAHEMNIQESEREYNVNLLLAAK